MTNKKQKVINEDIDYLRSLQLEETKIQNNRMTWIITAQALVFAVLSQCIDDIMPKICSCCGLVKKDIPFDMSTVVICLMLFVGLAISISALYSMLVSKQTIGDVMDTWKEYNSTPEMFRSHPIPHKVMAAPEEILNSKLSWLALHDFVPIVFCSAWIVLFGSLTLYFVL